MTNGISIYLGLDNTPEENIELIKKASARGIKRIFTSLHIPETDKNQLKDELQHILQIARKESMDVITDVSPATTELLDLDGFSLDYFARLGLTTLRLDYGFGVEKIAEMSQNTLGIKIQLNASTITKDYLKALIRLGANADQLEASHNFFPRENTGLDEDFVWQKTSLLHKYGIKVSAFIPSFNRPRSPICAGLPTLELHRKASFDFALRHLLAMGMDSVFVGDSLPHDSELKCLGEFSPEQGIFLRPDLWTTKQTILDLLANKFTTRMDEARDVIRTQESRQYFKEAGFSIKAEQCGIRNKGYVTLDNENYGRYQGELQILKVDLPADYRVNVVASLSNNEMLLLKYLTPGKDFCFLL